MDSYNILFINLEGTVNESKLRSLVMKTVGNLIFLAWDILQCDLHVGRGCMVNLHQYLDLIAPTTYQPHVHTTIRSSTPLIYYILVAIIELSAMSYIIYKAWLFVSIRKTQKKTVSLHRYIVSVSPLALHLVCRISELFTTFHV